MRTLFLIGNGFDLAHGLSSSYSDFRKYLIKKYPNARKNVGRRFYIEDYIDMPEEEFALEILLGTMDKAAGLNWGNLEEALATINFQYLMPFRSEEDKEKDDPKDIQGYLMACGLIGNLVIESEQIWQCFFVDWICSLENEIHNKKNNAKEYLQNLFKEQTNLFLTFNYTQTLQHLYGIENVVHIHNKVGDELIFGHGSSGDGYHSPEEDGMFISSNFDDFINDLRKDTKTAYKNKKIFFDSLSYDVNKVYSYGFSFSKVDAYYIKHIIRKISHEAIWYFTEYEANNLKELENKKIMLRNCGFKGTFDVF